MRNWRIQSARIAFRKSNLALFWAFLFLQDANAQAWTLLVNWNDVPVHQSTQESFRNENSLREGIDKLLYKEHQSGFIGASIDSLVTRGSRTIQAYLYRGPQVTLVNADSSGNVLSSMADLETRSSRKISELEESGHPFNSQGFKLNLDQDTIFFHLYGSQGNLFTLDSIVQLADPVVDNGILSAHLRLKKGQIYQEERLSKVDARLKRLPFLKVVRPSELIFTQDSYRLLLAIEKRKANSANGILGFQPDENGKLRTTGEIELSLFNALNRADQIRLNWRRLQDTSQKLKASFAYPYLFKSPLGLSASLDQFRQDSTFNQVESELGLSLLLDNGDIVQVDIGNRAFINLLEQPALVDLTDSRSTLYGLSYNHNTLDDQFNPYAGVNAVLHIKYGNKSLSTSDDLDENEVRELKSWEAAADIRKFFPLVKRSTIMLRFNGFHQESDVILYKELQRIGGLFTLRGMDELSIRASTYGVFSTEFRYLTDERAYVSLFADLAYYEAKSLTYSERDTPYGMGLGTAFDTGAGVFTLNYALGSRFSQPLSFRTAKLHFGYTAFF